MKEHAMSGLHERVEIVFKTQIGHEAEDEREEANRLGHLVVGHQLLRLRTHHSTLLTIRGRTKDHKRRTDDVHIQSPLFLWKSGRHFDFKYITDFVVSQHILSNKTDAARLGKPALRTYFVADYGYCLVRERFVVDVIDRSSDMVHYAVIATPETKQISARFIVMGRDMLNGTNRLYPEKSAFTT